MEVLPLIHPKVLYERFTIDSIRHAQLRSNGGGMLKGEQLTRHLGMAEEILSSPISQSMSSPVYPANSSERADYGPTFPELVLRHVNLPS